MMKAVRAAAPRPAPSGRARIEPAKTLESRRFFFYRLSTFHDRVRCSCTGRRRLQGTAFGGFAEVSLRERGFTLAVRVQIDVRRVCSALEADRGSLKLVFRHPSLRRPPMKVFSLQVPIYRGASLSSRLTAQTSQLAAVRRDAPKGMKPIRPGELVQIDTLFLFVNVAPDKAVKHFTAYDPVAKWTVALVAGRATARCAAALLDKLIAEVPFRIEGIQVDGGSEFRAEFEDACRERNLCLFVLPPKRPQLNGHVERAQGSWRYEFYGVEDLPSRLKPLQLRIDAFAHRFNHT